MKAITNYKYGGPEVLKLDEIGKPVPAENEVLIKVCAASVNPLDWHIMRGTPYFMRLFTGLVKPTRFNILGADLAGVVEQIGPGVEQFAPGDEVFADSFNFGMGGLAEYVCLAADGLVRKPDNLNFAETAAVPVAALTALHALRKFGIKIRQKVLINGASGGVGTFAVQMAKVYGAHVTGICSTRNLELVKKIGADQVIDYTQNDITEYGERYDLIIDAVGNFSLSKYRKLLTRNGKCAVVGYGGVGHMIRTALLGGSKIKMVDFKANQEDLTYLKDLIESGSVSPVIDQVYPLSESAEAMQYLEKGHARGKVVININGNI